MYCLARYLNDPLKIPDPVWQPGKPEQALVCVDHQVATLSTLHLIGMAQVSKRLCQHLQVRNLHTHTNCFVPRGLATAGGQPFGQTPEGQESVSRINPR